MTHTLHREGDAKSLENDYVILITPAIGINDKGSGVKLRKALQILLDAGLANIGDVEHGSLMTGLDPTALTAHLTDGKRIRASIADKAKLKTILESFKKEELGLSITVSGLIDNILRISKEVGLKPHTINMSLGVWGNLQRLPAKEVLEVTTMCGHHMISSALVADMMARIKAGTLSPDKATDTIGKLCVCGIFNPHRCKDLFQQAI